MTCPLCFGVSRHPRESVPPRAHSPPCNARPPNSTKRRIPDNVYDCQRAKTSVDWCVQMRVLTMSVLTSTKQEVVVQKAQRSRVFSPKTGKKKEKGGAKPAVSFRAPDDVVEWLQKLDGENYDRTDVIVTALRVGRDVSGRIGDKWYEIEYRAKRNGIAPGEMLAELALAAIESENAAASKSQKK